ncbi:hypothetical protein BDZ88DRAFT_436471 [Geranomyces variabilis]|nr:hypothetical protein BDZ88DRAFT_436471 [Geranomyces variabilis]KAJ3139632.1 hypothetical protein HDU90_009133 [Geranomyces variabilis]
MGRSAKFNRVGKTKKERDAIKITMNSRISKKPASGPTATRKSATSSSTAVPTAANKLAARKGGVNAGIGSSRKSDTAMAGVITTADKTATEATPEKKHVLSGRVDYVSLMNSRRSAKALKELQAMKP